MLHFLFGSKVRKSIHVWFELDQNERDDLRAVRFRIVKFDETAGVQISHDSPPRASDTTALRGFPGGTSPHTALARERKSGMATGFAGTTLATT